MSDAVTIQERIARLAHLEGVVSEEQLASVAGGSGGLEELIRSKSVSQEDVDHLLGISKEITAELSRLQDRHFGAVKVGKATAFQSEAPILMSDFEDDVVDTALPPEQWRPINEIFFDLILFFWYLPLRLPRPVRVAAGVGVLAACSFACFKYWPEISSFLMPPHVEQPRAGSDRTPTEFSEDLPLPEVSESRQTDEIEPSRDPEPSHEPELSREMEPSRELAAEPVPEPSARFDDLREILLKYATKGDLDSGLGQLAKVDVSEYSEEDRKSHALATCTFLLAKGDEKAWPQVAKLLIENVALDSDLWTQHFAAWLVYADKASVENAIRRISEVADKTSPEFLRIDAWALARIGDAASASTRLKALATPDESDRLFLATALFRDGLANPAKSESEAVLQSAKASSVRVPAAWEEFGNAKCSKIFLDAAQKLSKQLGAP